MRAAARIPIQVLVGMGVKAHRLRRNWTQAYLAELVGISEQGLSKIERGESSATLQTLEGVAGALGVTVRDLFPASSEAEARDDVSRRIMAHLSAMSPAELERVEAVVKALR